MYLMRHGECYQDYSTDPKLTKKGIKQVQGVSMLIKEKFKVTKIFHSKKRRAIETSNIISSTLDGIELIEIRELREVSKEITSEESCRVKKAVLKYIKPNIPNDNILIVSHWNMLKEVLRILFPEKKLDHFKNYSSLIRLWFTEEDILHISKINIERRD